MLYLAPLIFWNAASGRTVLDAAKSCSACRVRAIAKVRRENILVVACSEELFRRACFTPVSFSKSHEPDARLTYLNLNF